MSGQILSDPRGSHLDVRRPGFVARAPVRFGWMSGQILSDPLGSHLGEPHRTVGDATTSMAEPAAEIQAPQETAPDVAESPTAAFCPSDPTWFLKYYDVVDVDSAEFRRRGDFVKRGQVRITKCKKCTNWPTTSYMEPLR